MTTSGSQRSYDRDHLIWDLLLAGWDREEIGRRIGYASSARMSTALDSLMRRRGFVDALDQSVALQIARLDRLQASWWDAALQGDLAAAALVERIIEHRSALMGATDADVDVQPVGGS
jgi:hypothetical protein